MSFTMMQPGGGPVLGVRRMLSLGGGRSMPALGFGTYRLAPAAAAEAVAYAVDQGFRHIDCAPVYGNQREVGEGIRAALAARRSIGREGLFVTSKLWPTAQHPSAVERACRATLDELRLDYLDLYLVHWPIAWRPNARDPSDWFPRNAAGGADVDEGVTLADTWRELCGLVAKGLARNIGLSNSTAAHVDSLEPLAAELGARWRPPAVNQVELHPFCGQSRLVAEMGARGVTVAAYSPLGSPTRFTPPGYTGLTSHDVVVELADRCGMSPARLLLSWNLDNGNAVIVKATGRAHIADCAKAASHAMPITVRWVMDKFDSKGYTRVVNPTDFTKTPGVPFFKDS